MAKRQCSCRRTPYLYFTLFTTPIVIGLLYLQWKPSVRSIDPDTLRIRQLLGSLKIKDSDIGYTKSALRMPEDFSTLVPTELHDVSSNNTLSGHGNTNMANQADSPEDQGFLGNGYTLAFDYYQQLTGALVGYFHLAKIAGLLNLSVVEPYVKDTHMHGVPKSIDDSQVLKLSYLYDIDDLRSAVTSCANTKNKLTSFESFTENASHQILFVFFLTALGDYGVHFKSKSGTHTIIEIECNAHVTEAVNKLNQWTFHVAKHNGLQSYPFNCSRTVLVDARSKHPLLLSDITEVLGSIIQEQVTKFGSATMLIDSWKAIHSTDNLFYYFVPGFIWTRCEALRTIQHSQAVINASQHFAESLNQTKPVVGVHIRGERLLINSNGNITACINCLQQLKAILQNIAVGAVYLFHDLGQYGSMSCSKSCIKGRSQLLFQFTKLGFPVVYFDPGKQKNAPMSPAFVAFVEREYLSHVDTLVTVGGGGFQLSIAERFLEHSRGKKAKLYRLCNL